MSIQNPYTEIVQSQSAELFDRTSRMLADVFSLIDDTLIDTSDPREIEKIRVFKWYSEMNYRSLNLLMEKLINRESSLESAQQMIDAADSVETIRDVLKLLGAIRVQDATFDHEVDMMREAAHMRRRQIAGEPEPEVETEVQL